MSRIGKRPITIPKGVKVQIDGLKINIEGPKGKHLFNLNDQIKIKMEGSEIVLERGSDSKKDKSIHGLMRSLLNNAIQGVTEGYVKELEIEGVGFRAQAKPKTVTFALGYSHAIEFPVPEGIKIETPKPTNVIVRGVDKYQVGQVAANIRRLFEPEPYKGKGVRYKGEVIRRKQGKAVG